MPSTSTVAAHTVGEGKLCCCCQRPNAKKFLLGERNATRQTMKYSLGRNINGGCFLPEKLLNRSLLFRKTARVVNKFSMEPTSVEAAVIQETIQDCESGTLMERTDIAPPPWSNG
ncbi:hypothetical protein Prudu_003866 [Prunus dulcis]|uniref:Uncharacterized protein n=1 Tax=Prunus dulcis TaxID=3755 RepID=A0A4Y1QU63_PRUDU|nr:hypothetical protein Prudu_003866 [Prunus dulcis]